MAYCSSESETAFLFPEVAVESRDLTIFRGIEDAESLGSGFSRGDVALRCLDGPESMLIILSAKYFRKKVPYTF